MTEFIDRFKEVEEVCKPVDEDNRLLIIYGESGLGKTSLLEKAIEDIKQRYPQALAFIVDFDSFTPETNQRTALLRAMAQESGGVLNYGVWRNEEQAAGQMIARLNEVVAKRPVYLMFDTTEVLQENTEFWEWMQKYIVEPLVVEGDVKQIFAGRVPAPLRRGEVGNARKLLQLGPIGPDKEAAALVHNALKKANPDLDVSDAPMEQITKLILEFSFGHPMLTEKIATYVAERWPFRVREDAGKEICKHVVKPFIDNVLFEGVKSPWKEILWWASILDSFSADILNRYIERVAPDLIVDEDDYFFFEGIGKLKTQKTVLWRAEEGERLQGLIQDITERCFKTLDPKKYQKACQAAGETFDAIADEFIPAEPEYAERYQDMATSHYKKCGDKE
jgi:hypothetical protein